MLMIRFQRVGRRNQRTFRLTVTQKTTGADGKPVEFLGSWNPRTKAVNLKKERISYWISQGAKPSSSAHNLLVASGIIVGSKIPVHKKAKARGMSKDETPRETTPSQEVASQEAAPEAP